MAKKTRHFRIPQTAKRGLRPPSSTIGAGSNFSAKAIRQMGEKVERILDNSFPHHEKEIFLLRQIRWVCLFRQASDPIIRDKILREIKHGEKMGQELGFTQEDLRSLNRWILEHDLTGKLEILLEKVERKRA